jgi:hypothetical protein
MTRTAPTPLAVDPALIAEREALTDALERAPRDAYPSTRAYREEMRAMLALEAFDERHPEVIRQINDEHAANHLPSDPHGI